MKARRKGTTEWQDIKYAQLVGQDILYQAESLEFKTGIMATEQTPASDDAHWQDVRERAAIAAMQGIMNFFGSLDYNKETIAELAVKQADTLVEQLRKAL